MKALGKSLQVSCFKLGYLIFRAKLTGFRITEEIKACFWVCHGAFPESTKARGKESIWTGPNPRVGVWEEKRIEKGIVSTRIACGPEWGELLCPSGPSTWLRPPKQWSRSLPLGCGDLDLFTESAFLWGTHLNLSIHLPILINLLLLPRVCSSLHWFEPATIYVNCTSSFCFID